MPGLVVNIHRIAGAKLPVRATTGSAGMDVFACLPPDIQIDLAPGERITVPTGLSFEIPVGYFISLRPRSGWAAREGITLLNTPATIDSDYRGELKILIINQGHKTVCIEHGQRLAQLILEKSIDFEWNEIEQIDRNATQRSEGGFGSTGLA